MNTETAKIAKVLADARRNALGLSQYPGPIPTTLTEAYAIQDALIAHMARPIAGWKVGRINGAAVEQLGANRLAGSIFDDHIFHTTDEIVEVPAYADGFSAAEAEFMLRIGRVVDPVKLHYTLDEAAAMIDQICVGIELASSPFQGINDNGPAVTASDLGNSKDLIIGAPISVAEHGDYTDWNVSLKIDGVVQGEAKASGIPDGPIGAVRFLLELLAMRGIAVPAGTWVSTGAITGVHQIGIGQRVDVQFGNAYSVSCKTKAALPA